MLRYFLKISLLKKILQFQDRICFFIKSEKKINSVSDWWGNTKFSFQENARGFSKNSAIQENIKILRLNLKDSKTYAK